MGKKELKEMCEKKLFLNTMHDYVATFISYDFI